MRFLVPVFLYKLLRYCEIGKRLLGSFILWVSSPVDEELVGSIFFPVIHNLLHNLYFFSVNFDRSWPCEASAQVHGFIRKEVEFELRPCNPRMDAGHLRPKCYLIVVVIIRFFKD
jgi:hypothetical protein